MFQQLLPLSGGCVRAFLIKQIYGEERSAEREPRLSRCDGLQVDAAVLTFKYLEQIWSRRVCRLQVVFVRINDFQSG